MGKLDKLLLKILGGNSDNNINFNELESLLKKIGYIHIRTSGSHQFFYHPDYPETINIQPNGNKAKRYQVKQIREIFKKHQIGST